MRNCKPPRQLKSTLSTAPPRFIFSTFIFERSSLQLNSMASRTNNQISLNSLIFLASAALICCFLPGAFACGENLLLVCEPTKDQPALPFKCDCLICLYSHCYSRAISDQCTSLVPHQFSMTLESSRVLITAVKDIIGRNWIVTQLFVEPVLSLSNQQYRIVTNGTVASSFAAGDGRCSHDVTDKAVHISEVYLH